MNAESLSNPILGYKLDPGEPGLSHSSPASRSILRVLSQEISNWLAFKREAQRNGGVVIQGGIHLDIRKRGSFLAAVAGRTTAWIYYPDQEKNSVSASKEHSEAYKAELRRQLENIERKIATTHDPVEKEQLEKRRLLLRILMNLPSQLLKGMSFLNGLELNVLV